MKTVLLGLMIPFAGTAAGSSCVFLLKNELKAGVQRALTGFAAGVMVAASVWSLLIPSIEMASEKIVPAAVGFLAGIAFLLLLDVVTPHLHLGSDASEGPRSRLSRTAMLALAVTLHNLPEGMAVGVVFAGESHGLTLSAALAVSIGIAIQNIPEGAIISMPMHAEGNSRWRSFLIGSLSGVVEPLGSVAILLLASTLGVALP